MGEPANPTVAERDERHKIATAIVESVVNDESMPLPFSWPTKVPLDCPDCPVSDAEDLIFALAQEITILRRENAALTNVYVAAARLRQFPVPFDDHFALVGAVDECRSVLEPPFDDHTEGR